jgi:MAP3K TRAFs-binding domain
MPFGRKTDAAGRTTDFDAVYREIIAPAVNQAELDPIRADEEKIGGAIHKPMFERLMLCQYAVADITGANPNVYYELGIRHAMRPSSTVILFAEGTTLPFDIALLRGVAYRLGDGGAPLEPESCRAKLVTQLRAARANPHDDSPLFQLIQDMPRFEVDHSKTDSFRDKFTYSRRYKDRLAEARSKGEQAVKDVAADPALGNLYEVEAGVVIDLYLSLRDVKAYGAMIDLYQRMPAPLQRARITREQLAFALNREGRATEAEVVLKDILKEFGPSSETYSLLGRIYKDRWEAAKKTGRQIEAPTLLKNAINAYLSGFQTDWRDAYPGVNAVWLMEMQDKPDARQADVLPVVRYAASQKAKTSADYWDHATLLELAVIGRDTADAADKLGETLASVPATAAWQLETTERNLRLIRELRLARGENASWIAEFEKALEQKRVELGSAQKPS